MFVLFHLSENIYNCLLLEQVYQDKMTNSRSFELEETNADTKVITATEPPLASHRYFLDHELALKTLIIDCRKMPSALSNLLIIHDEISSKEDSCKETL